jgi:tetratricopeptide (TPR) repeat protein
MADAAEARAAGELARAARLYSLALSKQPGNVAAMTGLGDVARSQGNSDIAMSHYGAALRANPNYGPAVLSCADLKWSTGDRAGAVELYRRLAGGAPPRVGERIAEFEKGASPKVAPEVNPESPSLQAPAPQAPAPEPPAAAAPAPAPEPAPATGAPGPAAQPEQGAQ